MSIYYYKCTANSGNEITVTSLCSASYVAVNMTLPAFAVDRRAAVDVDRKAAAPAADAPCSNRSICLPACPQQQTCRTPRLRCKRGQTDRRTDGRTPYRYIDPAAYYASSVNNRSAFSDVIDKMKWN